jgi:hypothetical protein
MICLVFISQDKQEEAQQTQRFLFFVLPIAIGIVFFVTLLSKRSA